MLFMSHLWRCVVLVVLSELVVLVQGLGSSIIWSLCDSGPEIDESAIGFSLGVVLFGVG